jgi:hypothetical protein
MKGRQEAVVPAKSGFDQVRVGASPVRELAASPVFR